MMMEDLLRGLDGPIATHDIDNLRFVVFNRPEKRNALSAEMRREFAAALQAANADDRIVAIIVTGAGGHFSAGIDIGELREIAHLPRVRPHPGEALRAVVKPTIAAVDGICVTGGLEIALSCSFIIASDRARFSDTHARVGGFPSWGLSALLPRAIGIRKARQMAVSGAAIDASTALAWGLVNEVTNPADLLARCIDLAKVSASCNRESLRRQFELMDRNEGLPLAEALANEAEASARWIADSAARSSRA